MKGFVLAAGFGERLRPITETVPKPLLPIGNLPLIAYAIRLLAHHGITDVIVNLHHLGDTLREALGDGAKYGVQITYSEEPEILGTGGALRKMNDVLSDETFVVINSDCVVDLDLGAVLEKHARQEALATMVLRQDPEQAEYGQIEVNVEGHVQRILGHGDEVSGLSPYMFAGVHVLEPRFLEYIPPDVHTCVVRYGYMKALSNGERLSSYVMNGYFCDAGTPDRYLRANRDALEQKMHLAHADPLEGFALQPKRAVTDVVRMGENVDLEAGSQVLAPVLLGDGARIGENARVGPLTIVGAKAQIGKDAVLQESIVLGSGRVEAGAELKRAVVGRKATLHVDNPPEASVDDSSPE